MVKKRARADLRGADADVLQIAALQSNDPIRIRRVLDPRNPVSASTLPHVIALLSNRTVAPEAMKALEAVAQRRSGALIDAMLDPGRSLSVRRRLVRILSTTRSQAVADVMLDLVNEEAHDLRIHCARALFRMRRRNPELRFDRVEGPWTSWVEWFRRMSG